MGRPSLQRFDTHTLSVPHEHTHTTPCIGVFPGALPHAGAAKSCYTCKRMHVDKKHPG